MEKSEKEGSGKKPKVVFDGLLVTPYGKWEVWLINFGQFVFTQEVLDFAPTFPEGRCANEQQLRSSVRSFPEWFAPGIPVVALKRDDDSRQKEFVFAQRRGTEIVFQKCGDYPYWAVEVHFLLLSPLPPPPY
jgi:hypothetical protein